MITLISHKKRDVVAHFLGQLFVLIPQRKIQKLILEELQSMDNDKDEQVRRSAIDSLDVISDELNQMEALNLISEAFDGIPYLINENLNHFNRTYTYKTHFKPIKRFFNRIKLLKPYTKFRRHVLHFYNRCSYSLYRNFLYSHMIKSFPELEYIEYLFDDVFEEKLIEASTDPYSKLLEYESGKKNALNGLSLIYANSFHEKGHIRRLKAFLDDEDYGVRQDGVNALSYVAKILISSNEKTFIKNLEVSMKCAPEKQRETCENPLQETTNSWIND